MAHDHERGQEQEHEAHDHPDQDALQECIEECLNCHVACTTTAQYCIAQGGALADPDHVGLLLDCAEMCQTSANFMLRGSPYHPITCLACAELCRGCEESCRSVGGEDEQLLLCAEACASCAEHCERMAETDDDEVEAEAGN